MFKPINIALEDFILFSPTIDVDIEEINDTSVDFVWNYIAKSDFVRRISDHTCVGRGKLYNEKLKPN